MSPSFRYRAARPDGRIVVGRREAVDVEAAATALAAEGLALLRVRSGRPALFERPVRRQDLAAVFRNVAILVGDGVPIERALAASESLVRGRLRASLSHARHRIREGLSVADAMEADPAFPRSVVGVVRSGERGSRLPEACASVADQLEDEVRLHAEIRSALAYPALILVVGVTSVMVMGLVVVPRFADILADLGGDLPAGTRLLLGVSDFLGRFGLVLALAVLGAVVLVVRGLRAASLRLRLHRVLLKLPLIGSLRMDFSSARICRALGGMIGTGMPLLEALDAARDAAVDLEVSARLDRARGAVATGHTLTDSLTEARVFSPLALQLVGVGESSGRLAPMLARAGDVVAERAHRGLRALVSLLEPLLVVGLGAFVAGVAAALLQAVYSVQP